MKVWIRIDDLSIERIKLTCVDAGDGDITNSGCLNNVSDDELLDRLILWHASCTVGATDGLHVSTVVLAASSITAFLGLKR